MTSFEAWFDFPLVDILIRLSWSTMPFGRLVRTLYIIMIVFFLVLSLKLFYSSDAVPSAGLVDSNCSYRSLSVLDRNWRYLVADWESLTSPSLMLRTFL